MVASSIIATLPFFSPGIYGIAKASKGVSNFRIRFYALLRYFLAPGRERKRKMRHATTSLGNFLLQSQREEEEKWFMPN